MCTGAFYGDGQTCEGLLCSIPSEYLFNSAYICIDSDVLLHIGVVIIFSCSQLYLLNSIWISYHLHEDEVF